MENNKNKIPVENLNYNFEIKKLKDDDGLKNYGCVRYLWKNRWVGY